MASTCTVKQDMFVDLQIEHLHALHRRRGRQPDHSVETTIIDVLVRVLKSTRQCQMSLPVVWFHEIYRTYDRRFDAHGELTLSSHGGD